MIVISFFFTGFTFWADVNQFNTVVGGFIKLQSQFGALVEEEKLKV